MVGSLAAVWQFGQLSIIDFRSIGSLGWWLSCLGALFCCLEAMSWRCPAVKSA